MHIPDLILRAAIVWSNQRASRAACAGESDTRRKATGAFFELRQYKVRQGKIDDWVRMMDEEIIRFQISKGMVITGNFSGESDDSVYFWIRRFETEAERERHHKAVFQSEFWTTQIRPRIPEFLDREQFGITRVVPTSRSPMQ